MPGHKGRPPFGAADLYALDTTELPNTDDLYAAEGGLREAMRLYAQAAGAAKTIFLHNGSTAGNHVMLQLYAREGETVLLPRNAHLSAVNACVLGGMRVKWMPVRCTPDGYCYLAEEDVLAALRANLDARAMLLVRPDYYGGAMREDVFRRIAAAAHRQGTKVVVDEAHGAHFPWCDGTTSAGALGADAWVQSVHKTLMGLTGSAVLHLADSADERRAWTLLRREQTSSPSFLLMLSIDDSRAWMEENGRAHLRALSEAVNDVRRRLVGTPYHDAYANWANLPVRFDPTRLVIFAPQGGKFLAEQLREAGLDVEMADERRVVLILSVMDDIVEIRRLPELLASIPAAEKKQFAPLTLMPDMPEAVLTPRQAAMAGVPVVFFTLEMTASELGERMVLAESSADPLRIRQGRLSPEEVEDVHRTAERMSALPVHVDDTPYINVDQLCVIAKSLRAKGLLGLLIVDYLQLLATVNPGRTREQEVAECSRKLKGLARSLGCPVIVSSQLNRQAEDRAGSPELRHLRESGAIEQDADLVILLHRPERYHIRVDPDTGWSTRGMGIATVAKHRNGATGKVYYGYNPSMTKIGEFAGTPVTAPANNLKRKEDERKSSDLFGGSAG